MDFLSSFFVGKGNIAMRSRHVLMFPLSDLTLGQIPVGGSCPCKKGRGDQRSRVSLRGEAVGLAGYIQLEPCPPASSPKLRTPLFRHSLCTLLALFFFLPGLHTTDNVREGLASKALNILRNIISYMPAPVSPKK